MNCEIGAETPNVKDEPRRERARLVPGDDLLSVASFRVQLSSTSRDRSRRWLWRLVRRIGQMPDVHEGKDEASEEQRVKARESTEATVGRNEHRPTRDATRLARPPHPKTASDPRIRRTLCVQRRRRH